MNTENTNTQPETVDPFPLGNATYCPEDNKLRFYSYDRFSDEIKKQIQDAGFRWAPKQLLWVAPGWTPEREDLLILLCGEIGDEDYSPLERAADRAERFEGYRGRRAEEAGESADRFEDGPQAFGYENAAKAEKAARRHDRLRGNAVDQWRKAEYWQQRTQGVISNAIYKAAPEVRRARIKKLEAERRKLQKQIDQAKEARKLWEVIRDEADPETATKKARYFAGGFHTGYIYQHPRQADRPVTSLYGLLTLEADPITGHEAAALYFAKHKTEPGSEGTRSRRWIDHYDNRITYEKAMNGDEGGRASEIDMIPGGFIRTEDGEAQILKVNKSSATGNVVSVQILGMFGKSYRHDREKELKIGTVNIERSSAKIYRAPTPEELEKFQKEQKKAKAEARKTKPKAPPLINPTPEDARRLQDLWQRVNDTKLTRKTYPLSDSFKIRNPQQIREMSQAEYSRASSIGHSGFNTEAICADGIPHGRKQRGERAEIAFKIRTCPSKGSDWTAPDRIIVLTDKPQKPLPIDWEAAERAIPQDPFYDCFLEWLEEQQKENGEISIAEQECPEKDMIRGITVRFKNSSKRLEFNYQEFCKRGGGDEFYKRFIEWTKTQTETHGELTYTQPLESSLEEGKYKAIHFAFSDGTQGSFNTNEITYFSNAEGRLNKSEPHTETKQEDPQGEPAFSLKG